MARKGSVFICQNCGFQTTGWLGKCPNCGKWGSLVESIDESLSKGKSRSAKKAKTPEVLSKIPVSKTNRIKTGLYELDRVLGGGLVPGQAVLLAGEPGIGKSTLLLEISESLGSVLYVCGEESPSQIKIRSERLKKQSKNLYLLDETDVDVILASMDAFLKEKKIDAVFIDSIQTITTSDLSGGAGSVGQVRESAFRLINFTKSKNIPLFLVGQVTKEGTMAGPAALAHMVDTLLWFEGDKSLTLRILRAIKNRFGPTDEVGIFQMEAIGLTSPNNLENLFISQNANEAVPGSAITCVLEGTRPIIVEIQSLVIPTKLAYPRRVAQGIDSRRLELLLAVLSRRCRVPIYEYDVFVNVVGGISIKEPAADLAICLSLVSAYFDKPLPKKIVSMGEVGLLGEIRPITLEKQREKESLRLGFKSVISGKKEKYLPNLIKKLGIK